MPARNCEEQVFQSDIVTLMWQVDSPDQPKTYADRWGGTRTIPSLRQRFWTKVKKAGPNECWEWTASTDTDGYGHIGADGKLYKANRLSFYWANGFWPKICRHTCDNPPCVNPAHLIDGTHKDNNQDFRDRGGVFVGQKNKTHCPAGHPYSGDNLYVRPNGHRACRRCRYLHMQNFMEKKRLTQQG